MWTAAAILLFTVALDDSKKGIVSALALLLAFACVWMGYGPGINFCN